MKLFVSAVAMALGAFAAVSPLRAAQIWGSEKFARLAPHHRASFLRLYRAFGILLCLGATLFAVESILFSSSHR